MRCPTCGFENPPGMRFCGNCGAALTRPARGEERKLVTVLFADVVGSTAFVRSADPEQVRDRMARFFAIAREEIERYGGTVEKFVGDAVMAVFGLPQVHEDDPERAARAAAAIRARAAPDAAAGDLPEVRIGVDSGEAIADPSAAEKGEFLVTGEVVNLAARLQQHAAPGQVLLGERTMLAVRRVARMHSVVPLSVKGLDEPLPAWELLDVAPPRERDLRATPFVGREEELDLLDGHLRRIRREARGHVVTLFGPAGVGKTRLAREFRQRAGDVRVLRGRALPYGTGVPLWALGEVIRDECGVLLSDPLDAARRKVEDAAARLEISESAPALLAVLGLGGAGSDLPRDALFTGMRAFFQALAARGPMVVILEDAHLAEEVTLDFVEESADWTRDVPVLLLVLSRPELLERRPTWMGGKRSATTLALDPLSGEESRALVGAVLGGKPAPQGLLGLVAERSGGNPLFIEEMLRGLADRGVIREEPDRWALAVPLDEVSLPDTVHAVIAARVDALPPPEKQALQNSSVVGKDFWLGSVEAVAGEDHVEEAVRALVAKDLLLPKRRSALAGEAEFTFRHILIRDVAYAMIPKAQRWQKHARCAEWLRAIAGDRHAEQADFIAHHWLQVIALRRELGLPPDQAAREQAVANLVLAGDRARTVYANTTALDHYSRALDLDPDPGMRLRAQHGRGDVWMLLGQFERAREDFAAVRAVAQQIGDRRWEAIALDHVGHSYRRQDRVAEALEQLEAALAISRAIDDDSLAGRILNHIGFTYFGAGRHAEAIRVHEEARALLEGRDDAAGLAESYHGLGENSIFQGRFRDGIQWLSRSETISAEIGNRSLAAENQFLASWARQKLGEYEATRPGLERSVATLLEIGDVWNLSPALYAAASLALALGDFGTALDRATRGLALARQIQAIRFAVFNLLAMGMIHRELEDYHGAWRADREAGDLALAVGGAWKPAALAAIALDAIALGQRDEAVAYLGEARQALGETQTTLDFPQQVTAAEGRVLLALGRAVEARETARALFDLATAAGTLEWRGPATVLWADAAAAIGDHAAAAELYREAAAEADRAGRAPLQWRALAGLAAVEYALGRGDDARAAAARAREIVLRVAGTVSDERLRAALLQSLRVQQVMSLAGA